MAGKRNATKVKPARTRKKTGESMSAFFRSVLQVFVVIMISGCVYVIFLGTEKFVEYVNAQRVEKVRIEGELSQVDQSFIQQVVSAYAEHSFLRIDLETLKTDLEAGSWVREVSVKREWPETLTVHVTEQQPIARWNNNGLLNKYGQVFYPDNAMVFSELPLLEGPDEKEAEVMSQYQKLTQVLFPHGLRLASVTLSPRGAWRMTLDNGVQVNIGNAEVVARVQRFNRLIRGGLFRGFEDIEYIDLRYRSGIAVRHRTTGDETLISAL